MRVLEEHRAGQRDDGLLQVRGVASITFTNSELTARRHRKTGCNLGVSSKISAS